MLSEQRINKLQALQNRAVKQIASGYDVVDSMKSLNILSVRKLIRLEILKLGYKVCNEMLPKTP